MLEVIKKGKGGSQEPRVIAISSGKGGAGVTNIVANLGIACQRMGEKVLIFDADLGLANIDIIFGLKPEINIESVITERKEMSGIIVEGPEGVSIVPASSGVQVLTNLSDGQKNNLIAELDHLKDNFDIILIDTGSGISSNVVHFNLAAEERIIVVTPEPTSRTDAYALMKVMFQEYDVNHFNLLMNMVEDENEAKSVFRNLVRVAARFMGGVSLDYAGYIVRDDHLLKAVSQRQPVLCAYPEAPSCGCFENLAAYLLGPMSRR